MTVADLIIKTLEVIREPDETAIQRTLEVMRKLPEPEDELDASLRLFIVDRAVAKYLGDTSS